jgi:hypothetical protein
MLKTQSLEDFQWGRYIQEHGGQFKADRIAQVLCAAVVHRSALRPTWPGWLGQS